MAQPGGGKRSDRWHAFAVPTPTEKFDRVLSLATRLPELRVQVAADLRTEPLGRRQVLAAGVRLLDLGAFRVGGEEYAAAHETFGLATLERRHVRVDHGRLVFDYPAKAGKRRRITIDDRELVPIVAALKRRRSGDDLLAYREGRAWVDVRPAVCRASYVDPPGPRPLRARPHHPRALEAAGTGGPASSGAPEGPAALAVRELVEAAVVALLEEEAGTDRAAA